MSSNKEKYRSTLSSFHEYKNKQAGVLETNPNFRPKNVKTVDSLLQAEKWRSIIIGEISLILTKIENQTINDDQIRQLNDSLNLLLKEKKTWEFRIKELGGNNHLVFGKDLSKLGLVLDELSISQGQSKGYKYFGRAKNLPEVVDALDKIQKKLNPETSSEQKDTVNKTNTNIVYYDFGESNLHDEKLLSTDEEEQIEDLISNLEKIEPSVLEFTKKTHEDMSIKIEAADFNEENYCENDINSDSEILFDFENQTFSEKEISNWLLKKKKEILLKKFENH